MPVVRMLVGARSYQACVLKIIQYLLDARNQIRLYGIETNFWLQRRLVSRVDTGKVRYQPCSCLAVEALGVAPLTFWQRGIDENLNELTFPDNRSGCFAVYTERRNECGDDDQTSVDEQPSDFRDTTNVLLAIFVAKAKILA